MNGDCSDNYTCQEVMNHFILSCWSYFKAKNLALIFFFYFPTLSHPPLLFHTSLILSLGFGGWDSKGCQEEFLGFHGNGISLWML